MDEPSYPVSIIIPVLNRVDLTAACLGALADSTPEDQYEVVLVDNGSTDATGQLLAALEGDVQVIRNAENRGFAAACNQGAAAAHGQHVLFLNNDTVPQPGWLEPLLAAADEEGVGIVGSRLLFPDGTVQHAGVALVSDEVEDVPIDAMHLWHRVPGSEPRANERKDVTAVTGACMLVTRPCWEATGGFDEDYWNGLEDVDLCLTAREHGWRVLYEPASWMLHLESESGPERFRRKEHNLARLGERWAGRVVPELNRRADGSVDWRSEVSELRAKA